MLPLTVRLRDALPFSALSRRADHWLTDRYYDGSWAFMERRRRL